MDKQESIRWLNESLYNAIEVVVSEYQKRKWTVNQAKDLSDLACHPCGILSDDSFAVFVKYSEENASIQFKVELDGLQFLSNTANIMIPEPIGIVPVESGTFLIMHALKAIERTPLQWKQIGKTLAKIHQVKSEMCGFHRDGFHGPLHQDNSPTRDWVTFYVERRLRPRLGITKASGNLPSNVASKVEKLIQRLPGLGIPDITPTLLHGDAQQNNFISTEKGTYVIDPAVYYGNPEIDLALMDCWQPVPEAVFAAYREEMPICPGFDKRRNLWRVSIYLAAVALEGEMHLGRLIDAVEGYV